MIFLSKYSVAAPTELKTFTNIKYPQNVFWFSDAFDKIKSGLFYIPQRLADKTLKSDTGKYIKDFPKSKTCLIVASGNSYMGGQSPKPENIDNCEISYTYKFFPLTIIQIFAARIAQSLGITDLILTDSSACASSVKVLRDVQVLLEYENYDRVVVLAVENGITKYMLDFFGETKTTLTIKEEERGIKPSAFDNINYGFYLGHGAALAVFEKENTVKTDTPEAQLVTACSVSEISTNTAGQTSDGQGYQKSILRCLEQSKLSPNDISVIKSHGTGTPTNNTAEKTAILSIFKNTNTVVTGYKQKIGHTLGVSGLLETCLLFDDLKKGYVPSFENRTEEDKVFLSSPANAPKSGNILSLASGMGNIYSAAIFKCLKVG